MDELLAEINSAELAAQQQQAKKVHLLRKTSALHGAQLHATQMLPELLALSPDLFLTHSPLVCHH